MLVSRGVTIGVPAAVLVRSLVASQLFGTKPNTSVTFHPSCAGTVGVKLSRSHLPAQVAASVDPARKLRTD